MTLKQKIHLLKMIDSKGDCDDSNCQDCIFYATVENEFCMTDEEERMFRSETNKIFMSKAIEATKDIPLFSVEEYFEELL